MQPATANTQSNVPTQSRRDTAAAQRQVVSAAGGAATGILLGLFLGIRLTSGATRIERRMHDLREAWDILRH